jgi:HK97 family phage portal protein
MGLLQRTFERKATDFTDLIDRTAVSASGAYVSEATALRMTAVWGCVRNISEDVATLPLFVYERLDGGGKRRATDHPLHELLHDQANPEMTALEFREVLTAHVLTWGNGYAQMVADNRGRVQELWPLLPDRTHPMRDSVGNLYYETDDPKRPGRKIPIAADQVLHVRGLGFDGLKGYSPIRMHAQAIGLGLAAEEFGARFFGQGLNVGGFFEIQGKLSDPAYERLKKELKENYGELGRSHMAMVLEEGMKFQHLAIPPDEAQFIETRKFSVAEIARIYRMPPHKIADMDRATFSNIEHQAIDYVVSTLRPWLVRWEQAIQMKLMPRPKRFFAEHLVDGLLRGDAATRAQALQVQFQNGALNDDEWREIENRNPLPDGQGQTYFVPSNIQTMEKAMAPTPTPTAPQPPQLPVQPAQGG